MCFLLRCVTNPAMKYLLSQIYRATERNLVFSKLICHHRKCGLKHGEKFEGTIDAFFIYS